LINSINQQLPLQSQFICTYTFTQLGQTQSTQILPIGVALKYYSISMAIDNTNIFNGYFTALPNYYWYNSAESSNPNGHLNGNPVPNVITSFYDCNNNETNNMLVFDLTQLTSMIGTLNITSDEVNNITTTDNSIFDINNPGSILASFDINSSNCFVSDKSSGIYIASTTLPYFNDLYNSPNVINLWGAVNNLLFYSNNNNIVIIPFIIINTIAQIPGPLGSLGPLGPFVPPPPIACFKSNSKILTDIGYVPIQELRPGDLIKTSKHGYMPISMIGKRQMFHPLHNERMPNQLYKCEREQYPELFEDLIITGCHSILVDNFKNNEEMEKTIKVNGKIYITDHKYRLPACVDERTSIYENKGTHTIYHLALEHSDYYMNYGIYANGLLVETCSNRYLKELSGMELIK